MNDLRQAAQMALETCTDVVNGWESLAPLSVRRAAIESLDALRAALAEPEQEMARQKPVAWTDGRGFIASHADSFPRGTTVSPLYTHQPTPRKPLTEEEIWALYYALPSDDFERSDRIDFARAIEKAHGIGEQT